ncbi:MAG: hypothetical protein Fur0010_13490 [Bdellovibrio sp.]
MEINDYSNRLAQARQQYRDAANEARETYNKKAEELEQLHKQKEAKQLSVFKEQKNDLEEQNARNVDRFDRLTNDEINRRTDRYIKDVAEMRDDFDRDKATTKREYSQKLGEISDAFNRAKRERDKLDAVHKENVQQRFEEGLSRNQKQFDEQLNALNKTTTQSVQNMRDQYDAEKKNLIHGHRMEKQQLVQDANIAKNKANDIHQLEKESLRTAHDQDIRRINNNHDNQKSILLQNKANEINHMKENFGKLTDNLNDKNAKEFQKVARQNKAEKRALEKEFADDRIAWERQTNKLLNEGFDTKAEDQSKRIHEKYQNQISNIRNENEERSYKNALLNERIAQDYQDELKRMEVRHSKDIDAKNADFRDYQQNYVGKLIENQEKQIEAYKNQYNRSELAREQDSLSSKQNLSNKLDNKEMEHQRYVKNLQDDNFNNIQLLRNEMGKEQTEFFEQTRMQARHEKEELKDELKAQFERKEMSLDKRIQMQEQDMKRTVENYEKRIENIEKKAKNEIAAINKYYQDMKMEDERNYKRALEGKEREFQKSLTKVRNEFDRKLANAKNTSDVQIAKLTERYENIINTERVEHQREMQSKLAVMTNEYQRLAEKSQAERENLIEQYEIKMDKLRQANMAQNEIRASRDRQKLSETENKA